MNDETLMLLLLGAGIFVATRGGLMKRRKAGGPALVPVKAKDQATVKPTDASPPESGGDTLVVGGNPFLPAGGGGGGCGDCAGDCADCAGASEDPRPVSEQDTSEGTYRSPPFMPPTTLPMRSSPGTLPVSDGAYIFPGDAPGSSLPPEDRDDDSDVFGGFVSSGPELW